MLIYGTLDCSEDPAALQLNFVWESELQNEPDLIIGNQKLGQPVPIDDPRSAPFLQSLDDDSPLWRRVKIVTWLSRSLAQARFDRHEQARDLLVQAGAEIGDWQASDGKSVIDYFLGREYLALHKLKEAEERFAADIPPLPTVPCVTPTPAPLRFAYSAAPGAGGNPDGLVGNVRLFGKPGVEVNGAVEYVFRDRLGMQMRVRDPDAVSDNGLITTFRNPLSVWLDIDGSSDDPNGQTVDKVEFTVWDSDKGEVVFSHADDDALYCVNGNVRDQPCNPIRLDAGRIYQMFIVAKDSRGNEIGTWNLQFTVQ